MKLKTSEYKALTDIIISKKLDPYSFTFSKKKGLVFICRNGKEDPFTFFRKKSTILDENKKWKDVEVYTLQTPSRATTSLTWSEVLQEFEAWLAPS